MKGYSYAFAVLVLGTLATTAGLPAPDQAPKKGGLTSASGTVTHGGQTTATHGQAPKSGGRPSASGKAGDRGPGGGKGSSSINGTGMGARH